MLKLVEIPSLDRVVFSKNVFFYSKLLIEERYNFTLPRLWGSYIYTKSPLKYVRLLINKRFFKLYKLNYPYLLVL